MLLNGQMQEGQLIELHFSGPYAWVSSPSVRVLRDSEAARGPGIYLWTVPTAEGELVYYVGETGRSITKRMDEHLSQQLSGGYRVYDPDAFVRGVKDLLWRGVYGPGSESSVQGFVDRLPELAPALVRFVRLIRFHIAPTDCDKRTRQRIEAGLSAYLRSQGGMIGEFQEEDIHYVPRQQGEEPIDCRLNWAARPLGAPDSLQA